MFKSAEDVMQWYIDGTLEENIDIATELIINRRIDNPAEFIRDLDGLTTKSRKECFQKKRCNPYKDL